MRGSDTPYPTLELQGLSGVRRVASGWWPLSGVRQASECQLWHWPVWFSKGGSRDPGTTWLAVPGAGEPLPGNQVAPRGRCVQVRLAVTSLAVPARPPGHTPACTNPEGERRRRLRSVTMEIRCVGTLHCRGACGQDALMVGAGQ